MRCAVLPGILVTVDRRSVDVALRGAPMGQMMIVQELSGAKVREMGRLLGWDQGEDPMDLKGLFAIYTLVEKPNPRL